MRKQYQNKKLKDKRTLIAIRNAPVRINYLTASTKAYEDEIHQARRMLDASIHQDDAERREREDLLEHAKELESVQKKKIFEMENIAEKERERMKQGKKKEKERLTFARELVTMSAEERKQKMNEIIPTHLQKLSPIPNFCSPFIVNSYDTLSNAFSISKNRKIPSRSSGSSLMYASTILSMAVASAMNTSGTNPFWQSETNSCTTFFILCASTRVKIL